MIPCRRLPVAVCGPQQFEAASVCQPAKRRLEAAGTGSRPEIAGVLGSSFLSLRLIAWLACAWLSPASAQVVNRPPVPEWVSDPRAQTNQHVYFYRTFTAPTPLLKSVLLGACEGRMEVVLNDKRVGTISGTTNATGFDVTGHLRAGTNVLVLLAVNPTGLAKVAVLLELNADLARQQWIISDTNWQTWLLGTKDLPPPVRSLGRVDADPKANPFTPDKALDAYNSWKLARAGTAATDPATFTLPPGFKAELVRSALPEEGSWIALAFDPQGRLTLAREKKGLLRLSLDSAGVSKVEVINDTLLECRGLLYAHGALYANANNSKTLVRLRDTQGTGQFDETTELLKTEGGVGHGRNHLKLGPDGWLWIAHGNNVHLPKNLSTNSPLRNFAHDRLIPCPWDAGMFDGDVLLPAGHILRMKPDGSEVQLWAGGLRNPLDIAFNEHGDLFTFDADMEWDVGCPWYMPNRVLHIVPGADYGWRRGTGRWPAWYPDTLPSVVDIGLASPTAVTFGHGAKFPAKYQKAFYICDWAYGRILAVHMTPQGASYTGTSELFVGGRPLNVTDVCIGPDGAMWFTTGGRGTQSGLYRVTAVGDGHAAGAANALPHPNPLPLGEGTATKARPATERVGSNPARPASPPLPAGEGRGEGERPTQNQSVVRSSRIGTVSVWDSSGGRAIAGANYTGLGSLRAEETLSIDWNHLALSDGDKRHIRANFPVWPTFAGTNSHTMHQVKLLLELAGSSNWTADALAATNQPWHSFGSLVLAREGKPESKGRILKTLFSDRMNTAREADAILTLRAIALTFIRLGPPDEAQRQATLKWLEPLYPNPSPRVNQMLVELLVYLRSPQVIAKTVPLLRAATASEDLLHYPFYLRYARDGWTPDARRAVFDALDRAERLPGGRTYFTSIANVRKELLASLTPEERVASGNSATPSAATRKAGETPALPPPRFVKDWKLADLEPRLAEVSKGRSYEGARTALLTAQCVHCHRVSNDPAFPNSVIGPELLAVGARFSRRDLLLHIIEPSAVIDEKFRQTRLLLKDGDDVSGMVEREADNKLFVRPSPLEEKLIEVAVTNVRERRLSEVSPMPSGLLNSLRLEQILDLLAYLEAAGDPKHRNFQP
jgi:putative heme-binding domain-containing protein